MEISEIDEGELAQLVAVRNAVWPHDPETVDGYLDWRRQANDMVWLLDRKSTRLNSSHIQKSRMPSSA